MATKGYVRSSKTRQHIYSIASNLFLEKGYEATTLKDIAEAADVSTGTLYRYFPSKGDFLVEIGRASVEHLKTYAEELPEDMSIVEAVLSVLLEDIRGTQRVFFSPESDGESARQRYSNDIRMAYNCEIYASKEHLDIELATRAELAAIYASLIERAKEDGSLNLSGDSTTMAQSIVAVFFRELDMGMYRYDYPYEDKFREKLAILFEGRLQASPRDALQTPMKTAI